MKWLAHSPWRLRLDSGLKAVVVAAVLATGFSSPAQASCGVTIEIRALVTELRRIGASERALSPSEAAHLQRLVDSIDLSVLATRLQLHGLFERRRFVNELIAEAVTIANSQYVSNPVLLRGHLHRIEELIIEACAEEAPDLATPTLREQTNLTPGRSDATAKGTRELEPAPLSHVAVLPLILFVLIAFLLAGQFLVRRIVARMNRRSACRISAAMESGFDIIDGSVTVLARQDCRFQPVNEGAAERLAAMADCDDWFLVIGPHRLPAVITEMEAKAAVVGFLEPTKAALHQRLLQASVVTPFPIKTPPSQTAKPSDRLVRN